MVRRLPFLVAPGGRQWALRSFALMASATPPKMGDVLLPVREATSESIAEFGELIGAQMPRGDYIANVYEGSVAMHAKPKYTCPSPSSLALATLQPRSLSVDYLERHFKHSQVFIPLQGKPFIAVLGRPTKGTALPDPESLEAFRFDGSSALCLHIGVWHEFPFALEPDTPILVVLSEEAEMDLAHGKVGNDGEATGGDLEKINVERRMGRRVRVQ